MVAALHAFSRKQATSRASSQYMETVMSDECTHVDAIRDVTPSALVLRIKQIIHRLRLDTATCLGLTRID